MNITDNRVMPTPTPRNEVIPGRVYLYRMNHLLDGSRPERFVFAARDRHFFKDVDGQLLMIDLEDGQVWQCTSGELYLVNGSFSFEGVAQ